MRIKNALDVGCGQGFGTFCLSHHFNVVGVDANSKNIKIARDRFPKLDFNVMDATRLKFGSSSFDFVLLDNVLEHLKSPNLALKEIKRVLKPGGKTKIVVPDMRSELFLGHRHPDYAKNIGHQQVFSSGEIERIMKKIGMKLTGKKFSNFLTNLEVLIMLNINKNKNLSLIHI